MNLRALARVAALVLLLLVCAPIHVATKLLFKRSFWPQRFLAAAAWIIGARVHLEGTPIGRHSLLIANHTSWLDILVLGGATNCTFVSKDELGHPLLHWLADQNATVYVKRTDRRAARDQAALVAAALRGHKPVTVFPEGTTGPGTHLLPFRSTLLEAANCAASDVEIRPVAVDYGDAAPDIGWWEESGRDNVRRLLGRRGTLTIKIRILAPLVNSTDRKQLALDARELLAQTLGLTLKPHSPIGRAE